MLVRSTIVLTASMLLVACGSIARPEVTDATLIGTWSHTFDDGSRADMVVAANGHVELVDMPTAVFLLEGDRVPSGETDLTDRLSGAARLSALQIPGGSLTPYAFMSLEDSGDSAQLYVAHLKDPIQLYLWYGQTDNDNRLFFERVE